ncbi:hypothetical protein DdX_21975 [Ditylenchus destructor]|uniref:Uncharacterized protein n=1 Tax=Ditylenchus destructor TaxID=166010 RepID=A0AAD4MEQ3_9BILA|nr:hypothetical protein DdX_21975 [Ditylenchus destructor]
MQIFVTKLKRITDHDFRHQIDEELDLQGSTAIDKNNAVKAMPLRWTDEWEAENVRKQNESRCSNNESSAEIENMRKKLQQFEDILAKFQRQFENNQLCHKTTSRNVVKSEIDVIQIDDDDEQMEVKQECGQPSRNAAKSENDVIEIGDDDEQTEMKQECGQRNKNLTAENENLRKKVQELERNVADSQKQLKQLLDQLCNNTTSRNVVKSETEVIQIDDDDEQTQVKQECAQTSQDVALGAARSEAEQNHNASAIVQNSPEAVPDTADSPALTDCQPTLLPVINQQSDMNEGPTEGQEVAPDVDNLTKLVVFLSENT